MNSDFYRQLYESLCDTSNDNVDTRQCLITKQKLDEDNCVTLLCGHVFHYDALLKEVYNRKYKIKNDSRIPKYKIQCPYCREIQIGILPYKDTHPQYMYVNYPEEYAMKTNKCKRILAYKNIPCNKLCVKDYCTKCQVLMSKPLCNYIKKKGKFKGTQCGKICNENTNKCRLHKNM